MPWWIFSEWYDSSTRVTRTTQCISDPALRLAWEATKTDLTEMPQQCSEQSKMQNLVRGKVECPVLTQRRGKLLRLVIVHHRNAERVEGNHAEDNPVEALSFHHAPDEEPEHFLFPPEVGRALILPALQTGTGKRRPWDRKRSHHTTSWQAKGRRTFLDTQTLSQAPETQLSRKLGTLTMD